LETPTVAVNENENLNFYQAKQTIASTFGNCKLCIIIASVTDSFICPRCRNRWLRFSTITWQWNHLEMHTATVLFAFDKKIQANGKELQYNPNISKIFSENFHPFEFGSGIYFIFG